MSAHTPGPWSADRHGNVWEGATAPGPTPSARRDALRIAIVEQSVDRLAEDIANARLIAAAPDLLAALEVLLDVEMPAMRSGEVARVWRQASQAVAKARGK